MTTYHRRAHTRNVNGKTVKVKASTVNGPERDEVGFWAAIFDRSKGQRFSERVRDRVAYERESYRMSTEFLEKAQADGWFDDCAKHGRNYVAKCRTCTRIQAEIDDRERNRLL